MILRQTFILEITAGIRDLEGDILSDFRSTCLEIFQYSEGNFLAHMNDVRISYIP